ncbi:MAG TPA: hypothetical protein VLV83_02085 [Acidobacteriota bacterium]|nr:hypothetical protein [Acidobacteriota bacterium]
MESPLFLTPGRREGGRRPQFALLEVDFPKGIYSGFLQSPVGDVLDVDAGYLFASLAGGIQTYDVETVGAFDDQEWRGTSTIGFVPSGPVSVGPEGSLDV